MIPSQWNSLIQAIKQTTKTVNNKLAIFDADGTLWSEDLGYDFFHYQISKKLILKPSWMEQFDNIYKNNAAQICAQIVQCNEGVLLKDYLSWFQDFLKEKPINIFSFQKELIDILQKLDVQIFVISASPQWIVQEALKYYNFPIKQTIGIQTQIVNERITDQLIPPLSIKEGKVEAFLNITDGTYPFFVSSNSISDLALLESATHIRWAVIKTQENERQYQSEQKLLAFAKEKNWFYVE